VVLRREGDARCRPFFLCLELRDWHFGQKQLPRFCILIHSMVPPQTGQG